MALVETTVQREQKASRIPEASVTIENGAPAWKRYEKNLFRFFFLYFAFQIVPIDFNFYRELFALDWSSLHVSNLFYLARYTPEIFGDVPVFTDWLVIAGVALAGTFVWGIIEHGKKEYNTLYYALRVVIRYRLAAALLAYGFIKFFPQQMPLPSVSNLNTNYGDIEAWKIFSMSTGIVPGYQSFLGLIEIAAALLLLNRKTATIGAFVVLPFTGNVILSNLAYEGGEYVYGSLLVTFALFLVAFDAIRLYRFANELPVSPNLFAHLKWEGWKKNTRLALKAAFIFLFVFVYGYESYASYNEGGYQYPTTSGLPGKEGIYNVKEFSLNGKIIPPSRTDASRWRDVVFEKWATLSVRTNFPITTASALTEEIYTDEHKRDYEYAGNTGRRFFEYAADTLHHQLTLKDRIKGIDQFNFTFSRDGENTIVLTGRDLATNDSLKVTLERIDKKYLLDEAAKNGRRRGLKL